MNNVKMIDQQIRRAIDNIIGRYRNFLGRVSVKSRRKLHNRMNNQPAWRTFSPMPVADGKTQLTIEDFFLWIFFSVFTLELRFCFSCRPLNFSLHISTVPHIHTGRQTQMRTHIYLQSENTIRKTIYLFF